jgi:hypothetical protein
MYFYVLNNVKKLARAAAKVEPGCEAMTSVAKGGSRDEGLARERPQCRMERSARSREARGKLSR